MPWPTRSAIGSASRCGWHARSAAPTSAGLLSTLSGFLRDDARTRAELLARQSWSVNAARMAVAAPWLVLILLATQRETLQAYDTPTGTLILAVGAHLSLIAYRLMIRIGRLARGSAGAAMNPTAVGALLGGLAGAGLLMAILASPPLRRPTHVGSHRALPHRRGPAVAAADRAPPAEPRQRSAG